MPAQRDNYAKVDLAGTCLLAKHCMDFPVETVGLDSAPADVTGLPRLVAIGQWLAGDYCCMVPESA